ncbi:uncharacterized protein PFL1_02894 [Pseudozyma flocculosa PF-1]|uniref:Uncharacterized protein n=2 Tax=Pseudozyma flocculosa TaxID=84751 RepID=A0A5C3F4T4_9BASI|nr:uncharacterized protein PFL1_02894 [Pseudozyma flocculosa PF-1]EPQ29674.1 hypothetical protein PFL1_02894 [Pseudozyma flocculosa PF-1]SPO38241.1 uncharacterized protein PSFLO_03718 [Pseudozyma flocculosa]
MRPTSSSAPPNGHDGTSTWYQHAPPRPPQSHRQPSPNSPQLTPNFNGHAPPHAIQAGPSRPWLGPNPTPSSGSRPQRFVAPPAIQQPHHTTLPARPQQNGYQLQAPGMQQQAQQNHPSLPPFQQRASLSFPAPMVSSPLPALPQGDRLPNPYESLQPSSSPSQWSGTFGAAHEGDYGRHASSRRQSSGFSAHSERAQNIPLPTTPSAHAASLSPSPMPPQRFGSGSSASESAIGRSGRQSSATSATSPQTNSIQQEHEFDDCPGCRAELDEALAASMASARLDEERRKQREASEMENLYAISASEQDARRRRAEEERTMLEKAVEDSKREAELLSKARAEEEARILEESRQAAQRESEKAAAEDQMQIEVALRASQAEERKRAEALEQELEAERAAIAESMRQQEEEWRRRESEERSLIAFFEHQSRRRESDATCEGSSRMAANEGVQDDLEDSEAEFWRFTGHNEAYDLAKKMEQQAAASSQSAPSEPSRARPSIRRPLPPVPGQAPLATAGAPALPTSPAMPADADDPVPFSIIPLDAPPPYEAAAAADTSFAHKPGASGRGISDKMTQSATPSSTACRTELSYLQSPSAYDFDPNLRDEAPSPVDSFAGPSPAHTASNSRVSSPAVEAALDFSRMTGLPVGGRDRRHSSVSINRHEREALSTPPQPPPKQADSTATPSVAAGIVASALEASPAHESPASPQRTSTGAAPLVASPSPQQQSQASRGKKAIAGVDFGFASQPFATQLEKVHEPGEGETAAKYYFPNALQLTSVTAPRAVGTGSAGNRSPAVVGTRGPYFVVRAHSWKSLLRALAWYGNTRIEAGPEEVADAASAATSHDRSRAKCFLRVEIEFVTPTKAEMGYGVGDYARYAQNTGLMPRTGPNKPPAHVSICMSLVPSPAAARAFHQSAAYRAAQSESKRLDAFYAGRGSARRLIYLPRQPPSLPLPMVKLAQHLHLAHTFSAACPTSSHTARHSPRDLHHAIERHDEGFIKKQKALASAGALLASGSGSGGTNNTASSLSLTTTKTNQSFASSMFHRPSVDTTATTAEGHSSTFEPGPSNGNESHVNLMDSEHEDEVDFNNLALEDGGIEQVEAMGKRARLKAKMKRKLGKRQGDGNVVDEDLATWITPFDVDEHD